MSDAGRAKRAAAPLPTGALPPPAAGGAGASGRPQPASYTYTATLLDVIDGDTVKLALRLRRTRAKDGSLGVHVYIEQGWITVHENLRLYGLNAAEHGTPAGDAATTFVAEWFKAAGPLVKVSTIKDQTEKYGRFLARVRDGNGRSLNGDLLLSGHALVWDGHGARPV